jgi:hypothetical protein
MLDAHTMEGRIRGTRVTILSGHYSQHRVLGEVVMERGWEYVREKVHAAPVIEVGKIARQDRMFE